MYKTRLQELCHQQMWPLPDYTVSRDGPDHKPCYRASVTVKHASYHAPDISKSLKEAQNKAAKTALEHFSVTLPLLPKHSSQALGSQSEAVKNADLPTPLSVIGHSGDNPDSNRKVEIDASDLLDGEVANKKESTLGSTASQDGTLKHSPPTNCSDFLTSRASLLCNKVKVYPCRPRIFLPEGDSFLPISDNMWVAVRLDSSNCEG